MRNIIIISVFGILLFSCKSKHKIVTKKEPNKTKEVTRPVESKPAVSSTKTYANATEAYIATFSKIAMEEMRKFKIPASITLAQGILESGSGKGRLAVKANNHFGIKCHNWTGKKIYHDDDRSQECFRKYDRANSSFEDHSKFLTTRGRYSKLFDLKQDNYKAWAKGLRAAGYATDRKYPEKLISLIERYKLYEYDDQVLGHSSKNKVTHVINHRVIKGDTLYSLSRVYGVTVDAIKRLNKLENNELKIGQILIIK
ncbi:N-acetylmuramidase [Flavobacteriales bacterium 34_180_T64]|nr:N-acetylmuramidase [Flavobacteriales bacterium 34_180_T64]